MSNPDFPQNFLWGAATSSFQVEGAAAEDGRTPSVWDTFCRVPGAVLNGDDGDTACDQYHRYRDDVDLMAALNIQTYRFSVSWPRVLPGGTLAGGVNQAGLDYYSRLVDALLDKDILPWLTLYHWDLPQVLEEAGGWTNRDTAYRFVELTQTLHDRLGDRVKVWTTLNEPWCSAFLGYTAGVHAPGRQSASEGLAAGHHLLLAHGLATQELRRAAPEAELGVTLNFTVADPVDPEDPADRDAARRVDGQFNRFFTDPIFRGSYPADLLEDLDAVGLAEGFLSHVRDGDLAAVSTPIETLGVNYYHGEAVSAHPDPEAPGNEAPVERAVSSPFPVPGGVHMHHRDLPRTDMGWEVQPEGLTRLLVRLHEEYTGPAGTRLYITENGAAYDDVVTPDGRVDDEGRRDFLEQHLRATADAIAKGADVGGYFAWSLLDNFEWAWGYSQRFGIVHVDFETQERTVKSSGWWYARVAAANALPAPAES